MITGLHGVLYTTEPEAARALLRDKLKLPFHDAGDGWLIFEFDEGHVGCHPADAHRHGISFACDDIEATVAELSGRGVECTPIVDEDWGRTTTFDLPGSGPVQIYQPTYMRNE
jgi:hypothetical protein